MLRPTVALLLLAVAPLGGCTAGLAVGRIVTAQKAVHDAESKGAVELAPYEYTLATLHLREAWEEHGDGEFKTCTTYADLARTWAEKAALRADGGGRNLGEIRKDVETLEDILEGREGTGPDAAPSGPEPEIARPKPKPSEPPVEDFLDKGNGDDEIELEEDAPPPPPPPPAPTPRKNEPKNEPKGDPTSPWGKRN